MSRENQFRWRFTTLLILLMIVFLLDLSLGTMQIPFYRILRHITGIKSLTGTELTIFSEFRLPRALTAILAGTALSLSGLQMQTLFRNPLAGPYILGISSGASLGVAIVVLGNGVLMSGILSELGIVAAAWVGAASVMMLILLVTLRVRSIMTILILGIMFSGALGAIISILQYVGPADSLKSFVIWSMGSLTNVTGESLVILTLSVLTGLLVALLAVKPLNAMMLGESYARSMGVQVISTRLLVFLSTSILAGTIAAFCGPVGFVGIAVPHITRFVIRRNDLRYLLPSTAIMGMIVLLISDIVSQLPGSERVLPLNAITSLIGIPVVVWVILQNRSLSKT